jgi:cyclopropane fatty-acyl-phospholipid synthase-like methyltransferase
MSARHTTIGLYSSPRIDMVANLLRAAQPGAPIAVEELLAVTSMNYGVAEFEHARRWFEHNDAPPDSLEPSSSNPPSLVDVGAGFGPAGLVFGARHYRVTAVEVRAEIAAQGERVIQSSGLQDNVRYEVTDVMAYEPEAPADRLISILSVLHIADKHAAMKKLASLLRVGGRGYIADFYARDELSASEIALLNAEVDCPSLFTRDEYASALRRAGFRYVEFTDVTREYADFVHRRLIDYVRRDDTERREELTRFYAAMDTLFSAGNAAASRLGGCRIYLAR